MNLGTPIGTRPEPRGTLRLWIPASGVFVTECTGHMSLQFAKDIVERGQAEFERMGRLAIFHDWEKLATYDSPARPLLTDWGLSLRRSPVTVNLLIGSKLVRMGVSVASIALGGMLIAHPNRAAFEAALRSSLRG